MADFLRPEARAAIKRWREAGIGLVVALLSVQLAMNSSGGRRGLAFAVTLLGVAVFIEGIRRARLPRDGGGAGVVEVDERQISYFGPNGGGAVAVEGLMRIEVRAQRGEQRFDWLFTDMGGDVLTIPSNAEGALAIFDAVSVLKGARIENITVAAAAAGARDGETRTVWKRDRARIH